MSPADERGRFVRAAAARNLKPLWDRIDVPAPGGRAIPSIWRYAEVRETLLQAGALISAPDAERRVLIMENPGLPETGFIGATLFAGMQLVLPGETVPAHRHTPNALRFIVEGGGAAYTTVDGARVPMRTGDLVVTPGWSWHDHGNPGPAPTIWLDGLDLPFAKFLSAYFRERLPGGQRTAELRRTLVYPNEKVQEQLQRLGDSGEPDPCHGYQLRFADPQGRDPLRTIAAFMASLPAGFAGSEFRSTETRVFSVAEGSGEARIGHSTYGFARHDVFVVPGWTPYRLSAKTRCLLFSYSDRAAQELLGFYRESFETAFS